MLIYHDLINWININYLIKHIQYMKPLTKSSPVKKAVGLQNIIDIDINRLLKLSISIEIIDIDFMYVVLVGEKRVNLELAMTSMRVNLYLIV